MHESFIVLFVEVSTPCFSLVTGLARRLLVYDQNEIKKTNWFTYVRAGEKGLAKLTVICKKLHHFFPVSFLSFIFSFFAYLTFYKIANDVVNGTEKVICMKGQCLHVRLKLFFFSLDLDVLAFAQFRHGNF